MRFQQDWACLALFALLDIIDADPQAIKDLTCGMANDDRKLLVAAWSFLRGWIH